jgi:hypothetical protein
MLRINLRKHLCINSARGSSACPPPKKLKKNFFFCFFLFGNHFWKLLEVCLACWVAIMERIGTVFDRLKQLMPLLVFYFLYYKTFLFWSNTVPIPSIIATQDADTPLEASRVISEPKKAKKIFLGGGQAEEPPLQNYWI